MRSRATPLVEMCAQYAGRARKLHSWTALQLSGTFVAGIQARNLLIGGWQRFDYRCPPSVAALQLPSLADKVGHKLERWKRSSNQPSGACWQAEYRMLLLKGGMHLLLWPSQTFIRNRMRDLRCTRCSINFESAGVSYEVYLHSGMAGELLIQSGVDVILNSHG